MIDLHTHSFLSDGALIPSELVRRALVAGYRAIAITDHVSYSNIDFVLENVVKDCQLAQKYWDVVAIPGVEITNVPAKSIDQMAEYAKSRGAKLVVEAVNSSHVDILAHPGLITEREAKASAQMDVFLEISGRSGHSLGNGRTALKASQAGARLLINTDSHSQNDLFKQDFQKKVGLGAGLSQDEVGEIIKVNSRQMLKKIGIVS